MAGKATNSQSSVLRRGQAATGRRCSVEWLETRRLLAINIQFDYSYDTSGFFTAPFKAALEAAASRFEARLTDNLAAISPGGANQWQAKFTDPQTGSPVTLQNPSVPADTLIIYVGRNPNISAIAIAYEGVAVYQGGDGAFQNAVRTRGQTGALAVPPTDFGPWGGAITFAGWHSWNTGNIETIANHEIGHLLGFGQAPSYKKQVHAATNTFAGPKSILEYDGEGNPPLGGPENEVQDISENHTESVGLFGDSGAGGNKFDLYDFYFTGQVPGKSFAFGTGTHQPIAGDFDGDGVVSVGTYTSETATFTLTNELTGIPIPLLTPFVFGNPGYLPITGDWNGDGVDSVGVYNPVTGTVYLKNSLSGGPADITFLYGPTNATGWFPIAGDWDADGDDTIGLYDSVIGNVHLRNTNSAGVADVSFAFGAPNAGWKAIAGDWDGSSSFSPGNGDTIGLYRPDTGQVYLKNSHSGGPADVTFSLPSNRAPVAGNWDYRAPFHWDRGLIDSGFTTSMGDANRGFGKLDFAALDDIGWDVGHGNDTIGYYVGPPWNPPFFSLRDTNSAGAIEYGFGLSGTGTKSITGDWNGDGEDGVGAYDPSTGAVALKDDKTGTSPTVTYSISANRLPIAGDWNGDGFDTPGLYDGTTGTFYLFNSLNNISDISFSFGAPNQGYLPIAGDWDDDDDDTIGLYHPNTATFFVKNSLSGGAADLSANYGPINMLPITGDWDGDGDDTIGIYNDITNGYFLRNSITNGTADLQFVFGVGSGDLPVAGNWLGDTGSPLLIDGAPIVGATGVPALTGGELQPIVDEALARWAVAGLSSAQMSALRGANIQITDLPGRYLGVTLDNVIYIDRDAAGHGWFIDSTPGADEEFSGGMSSNADVYHRVDLLTVVSHELGHVLGLEDLDPLSHEADLMAATLATGHRRLPSESALDAVFGDGSW